YFLRQSRPGSAAHPPFGDDRRLYRGIPMGAGRSAAALPGLSAPAHGTCAGGLSLARVSRVVRNRTRLSKRARPDARPGDPHQLLQRAALAQSRPLLAEPVFVVA